MHNTTVNPSARISSQRIEQRSINPSKKNLLERVLKFSFPVWPLQNTVAVNPFWSLREESFERVMSRIASITSTPLFTSLEKYREKLRSGEISEKSLQLALDQAQSLWAGLPKTAEQFKTELLNLNHSRPIQRIRTFAEYDQRNSNLSSLMITEVGKYASAYLDQGQALAQFPWKGQTFFAAWLSSMHEDRTVETWGLSGAMTSLQRLAGVGGEEAIFQMLTEMGVEGEAEQKSYLESLLFSVLGWSTQFSYILWQKQLGYEESSLGTPADLLAVRLAYDYLLFQSAVCSDDKSHRSWLREIERCAGSNDSRQETALEKELPFSYVCQLAWELTYQKSIASVLRKKTEATSELPNAQMVFCIDVRSEMLRRHIETTDSKIETLGFAGFFGLTLDYVRPDEKHPNHRLPVLLSPGLTVHEEPIKTHDSSRPLNQALTQSYFRNLRKGTLSSFTYVELFGAFYIEKMISQSLGYLKGVFDPHRVPQRFNDHRGKPSSNQVFSSQGDRLEVSSHVARLAGVLRHLGLTSQFAELVLIVGHGSETTNNAFGSSLDCGACGGHAGDINARFLVNLLNSPEIRLGLKQESIHIPDSTWFVAALHETVTDEVFILDWNQIPEALRSHVQTLEHTLKRASETCRTERQGARSERNAAHPKKRAKNWSEVRPEWALAGNASFIVAPRERTRGVNLSSRTFLHNYDWKKDEKRGFQTLELIMTAPMVVTNWINLQYYASTVAPQIYGSGNKVIHNLLNESAVIEGNGGDLRVGLPLQSVHDGHRWVHDPLRLSVFIEAPREAVESIIEKHQVVRDLLHNEWLHLILIDSSADQCFRRTRTGEYVCIERS